jgi:hypothetical protein
MVETRHGTETASPEPRGVKDFKDAVAGTHQVTARAGPARTTGVGRRGILATPERQVKAATTHSFVLATRVATASNYDATHYSRENTNGLSILLFWVCVFVQYVALALFHLALAIPMFVMPKRLAVWAFGSAAEPPEDQHAHLFQLYGSGLFASASMALALAELARRHALQSWTADTLRVGLMTHFVASGFLMFTHPATLTFLGALVEGAVGAYTAAIPASQMLGTPQDRQRVWRDYRNPVSTMRRFLTLRSTGPNARFSWLASLYAMLAVALPIAGAFYTLAPHYTLYHTFGYDYGKSAHLQWEYIGLAALCTLFPALLSALKHKADIGMLGPSIPRTLNAGLMAASLGHLLTLGPILTKAHGGWLLPIIIGTWGTALMTSLLGMVAREATQLAQNVVEQAKVE